MNIIEAIKSGKKYRRKGFHSWCHPLTEKNNYHFSLEDLLADDWEVESEPVTITQAQFENAWASALADHVELDGSWGFDRWENLVSKGSGMKKLLMKELGL